MQSTSEPCQLHSPQRTSQWPSLQGCHGKRASSSAGDQGSGLVQNTWLAKDDLAASEMTGKDWWFASWSSTRVRGFLFRLWGKSGTSLFTSVSSSFHQKSMAGCVDVLTITYLCTCFCHRKLPGSVEQFFDGWSQSSLNLKVFGVFWISLGVGCLAPTCHPPGIPFFPVFFFQCPKYTQN